MQEFSSPITRRRMLRYLGAGLALGTGGRGAWLSSARAELPAGKVADMAYRPFGTTDMRLGPVGLGGLLAHYEGIRGHPPAEEKRAIYLRAAELGINLFDIGYGDEVYIPDELKGDRDDLHFSLKSGRGGGAPRASELEGEVDGHLRNLRREAIDILRVHRYAYVGSVQLQDKIESLKRAGKVRFLCLIRHYLSDQEAYAANGPEAQADADLVIYNYVSRWQAPGIEQSAQSGKGVLVMKVLGGQQLSWQDKFRTDWPGATESTVAKLAVRTLRGEELALVNSFVSGPWGDLADPDEPFASTDRAVKWVLNNPNVGTALVAVASVAELEEAMSLRGPDAAVRPASWGRLKIDRR